MRSPQRLETLALMALGAVVLSSLWMWASGAVEEANRKSRIEKEKAVECSNFEVQTVDNRSNGSHTTVFLKTNMDVDSLTVRFNTTRTVTRNITGISKEALLTVSAPLGNADVRVFKPDCR